MTLIPFGGCPLHIKVVAIALFVLGWSVRLALMLIAAAIGIAMILSIVGVIKAGTCRYYGDGGYAVTACEDRSYTVRDRDGRCSSMARRMLPGQGERPVFERGDER